MPSDQPPGDGEPDDACADCGHPFSPHILVAYDDPLAGGLMFCQELETCGCVHTWDVPQSGRPRRNAMPPPHVLAEWRAVLLGQSGGLPAPASSSSSGGR